MFIDILFKMLLFKGGVLIYAEHCMYIYIYGEAHHKMIVSIHTGLLVQLVSEQRSCVVNAAPCEITHVMEITADYRTGFTDKMRIRYRAALLYNQIHIQVSDQYSVSADTLGLGIGKGKRASEHL